MGPCTKKKSFTCTVCHKTFDLYRSLWRHLQSHSAEERPFNCTLCPKTFLSSEYLKRHHQRRHAIDDDEYDCTLCDKVFSDATGLIRHLRTHTGEKPYKCTVCQKPFALSGDLRKHVERHVKEKFECTVCHRTFSKASNLKNHLQIHTGFHCTVCDRSFSTARILKGHLELHSGGRPFECTVCQKAFSRATVLKRHLQTHTEKLYECTLCPKTFSEGALLSKHLQTHSGEGQYECNECHKVFSQYRNLKQHLQNHTKPFECTLCQATFPRPAHLRRHILQVHTGDKPFECTVCQKAFLSGGELRGHVRTHTGERPFECTVCLRTFTVRGSLRKHLLRRHKVKMANEDSGRRKNSLESNDQPENLSSYKEELFECIVCHEEFAQSEDLSRHLEIHVSDPLSISSESPTSPKQPFECEIRPAHLPIFKEELFESDVSHEEFTQSENLSRHSLSHTVETLTESTGYTKELSELRSQSEFRLNLQETKQLKSAVSHDTITHLSTHTEEQNVKDTASSEKQVKKIRKSKNVSSAKNDPNSDCKAQELLSCIVCNQTFSQPEHLGIHLLTHGGEETTPKSFECTECNGIFSRSGDLKRHVQRHKINKPFKCPVCPEGFVSSKYFKRHMRSHWKSNSLPPASGLQAPSAPQPLTPRS